MAPPKKLVENYLSEIAKIYGVPFEPDFSVMVSTSTCTGLYIYIYICCLMSKPTISLQRNILS